MKLDFKLARALVVFAAIGCAAVRPAQIVEQFNVGATATSVRLAVERFHEALRHRDVPLILDTFIRDTSFRAYDGDEGWLTIDNIRSAGCSGIRAPEDRVDQPRLDRDHRARPERRGRVEQPAGDTHR